MNLQPYLRQLAKLQKQIKKSINKNKSEIEHPKSEITSPLPPLSPVYCHLC
jgi:hypothetical protein